MEKQSSEQVPRKKLTLKPVGVRVKEDKLQQKKKLEKGKPNRVKDYFLNQITPSRETIEKFQRKITEKSDSEPKFNFIEDPRESAFSHRKFILIQKSLFILVLFYIFISIIKTEIEMKSNSRSQQYSRSLELVLSVSTVALIFALFLRYVCRNELQINQKKFYYIRRQCGILADVQRFFDRTPSVKLFALELILMIPHPMTLLSGQTVNIFQSYDEIYLQHQVNDILSLISLLRIYILFRSLVNLTIYSTPRAARLCAHNGIQHNFLYSIKCLLKQEPLRTISFAFLILAVTLGYGMKLSQGTLTKTMPNLENTGFENLINCFWCIFITMTTVGYGDYYPKTLLGRLVIFITSICGVILSSLLIVSLSAYLTMQPTESKSHVTLHRLQHQQKMKKEVSNAMVETIKLTKFLSSKGKESEHGIKQIFTLLKTKIDKVKLRNRQIKALVNNNNIIEEMNRLFELFKDNLEESFRNQIVFKKVLNQLEMHAQRQK